MDNTFEIMDYVCAGMLVRNKTWRAGQGLFNAIDLVRPDIANKIRGTPVDPFYDNKKIKECLIFVKDQLIAACVDTSKT